MWAVLLLVLMVLCANGRQGAVKRQKVYGVGAMVEEAKCVKVGYAMKDGRGILQRGAEPIFDAFWCVGPRAGIHTSLAIYALITLCDSVNMFAARWSWLLQCRDCRPDRIGLPDLLHASRLCWDS